MDYVLKQQQQKDFSYKIITGDENWAYYKNFSHIETSIMKWKYVIWFYSFNFKSFDNKIYVERWIINKIKILYPLYRESILSIRNLSAEDTRVQTFKTLISCSENCVQFCALISKPERACDVICGICYTKWTEKFKINALLYHNCSTISMKKMQSHEWFPGHWWYLIDWIPSWVLNNVGKAALN